MAEDGENPAEKRGDAAAFVGDFLGREEAHQRFGHGQTQDFPRDDFDCDFVTFRAYFPPKIKRGDA
jgi:hypothetical protein